MEPETVEMPHIERLRRKGRSKTPSDVVKPREIQVRFDFQTGGRPLMKEKDGPLDVIPHKYPMV